MKVVPTLTVMALHRRAMPTTILAGMICCCGDVQERKEVHPRAWVEEADCTQNLHTHSLRAVCLELHHMLAGWLLITHNHLWSAARVLQGNSTLCAACLPLADHFGVAVLPLNCTAAGAEAAVLISEHGHLLDSLWLPGPPVQPLLVVDFNGDGLNDIVLVTNEGVFG